MEALKKFSPAFYGVIILCFFLPFVNLSCSGQKIMGLSGFQLITGSEYKADSMFGEMPETGDVKEKKEIDAQPLALFAFLLAGIGLALSFIRKKTLSIIHVILSALGVIFLFLLKINLDGDVELSGQNVITLDYQFAYWFSILLFIGSAVVHWLIFSEKAPPVIPTAE
jgi:hypothetical protein